MAKLTRTFNSSCLAGAEYDEESQILTLTFTRGGSYIYPGVTKQVFEALSNATSAGQFYNSVIRMG